MHPVLKVAGVLAAALVVCAVAIPVYLFVASEAVIERRYPLPAIGEPAAPLPKSVERGAHLARIAGCSDCHGIDFEGRRLRADNDLGLWSSNLRVAAPQLSGGEFERALRRGIAPDAKSLWGMPAAEYMYMSEADVASLFAYFRSLGVAGGARASPVWNRRARVEVLDGRIVPSVLATRDAPSSLDLGSRYDGGRYLARIACSECHGTDLGGSPRQHAPDLDAIVLYNRPAFFDLLRRGSGARHRRVPAMMRLASIRFHVFADYEIVALYEYLDARAHAPPDLVSRARQNQLRRRAAAAADNQD